MIIIDDDTPVFPKCPGYGFSVDPFILCKIVEREGGFERVDRKWNQARREYDGVPIPDNALGDIEEILYFWLAVGGMAGLFRFLDRVDYKSCRTYETPTAIDQPVLFRADSPSGYQLLKQYTVGSLTHVRTIRRPIASSLMVANELGVAQSDFTVYESTGLIVPGGGFAGTPTTWGGQFHVWCRFKESFRPQIVNKEILSADVSIIEKRERAL